LFGSYSETMMLKQETSILQWASIMLEEDVRKLSSIQDVAFVRNMLWRIDPTYFSNWKDGRGTDSYTQVLQAIAKYFQEEIGTDVNQHIQSLNAYKNITEVWELLLGIAIKGSNRGKNITLILDMDHAMQAELMGIVTGIIDKFGQNASNNQLVEA
jgi:hypothetical protein